MDGQVKKLQQKVGAGAHFSLTQLCYDEERIAQIPEATRDCGIPVLPGVMPFVSHRNALFTANEVPGVSVPDDVVARMEGHATKERAAEEGLEIARGLLSAALRAGAPGAYLVAPFNRAQLAVELVHFVREEWRAVRAATMP